MMGTQLFLHSFSSLIFSWLWRKGINLHLREMAEKLGKTHIFTLILMCFGQDDLTPEMEAAMAKLLQSRR